MMLLPNLRNYYLIGLRSKMNFRILHCLLLLLAATACGSDNPKQVAVNRHAKSKEVQTSEMHKQWIAEDREAIAKYVERRGWTMTETGTGTLYYIYSRNPEGELGEEGRIATVEYTVQLLDGTMCYSSDEDGAAMVRIEKDDIESGIHELLKIMRVGEKAAVILHPHRAHGLIGDMDKIGPQTVVIYNLEMISLQ
jgi:FKBP-type peptidyl-prolyl cis-trans isomerase